MKKQILNEEFKRMKLLAGLITESQLDEDILELKQMSKQLYSLLKSKGFNVNIVNKIVVPVNGGAATGTNRDQAVSTTGGGEFIQIMVQQGVDGELVEIAITPSIIARAIVGGGITDWSDKARAKFGNDWNTWQKNPEIVAYVNKLGDELLAQIKAKYPNMAYKFAQQNFYYILYFGYAQTMKGGNVNPNQRPNAPKPAAAAPVAAPVPVAESAHKAVTRMINEALNKQK